MKVLDEIHDKAVFGRRVRVLVGHLAELVPQDASVLDVGCGDGSIAQHLHATRPDLRIEGIDVLLRPETQMPVAQYDGKTIPFASGSFDVAMLVDVLHHADDAQHLLAEATRVARRAVVIKDHCRDGVLANSTLRFMDWVGNARHGVSLPYSYWPEARWHDAFRELGLREDRWIAKVGLYPWPFSMAFDRKLHFIAKLVRA